MAQITGDVDPALRWGGYPALIGGSLVETAETPAGQGTRKRIISLQVRPLARRAYRLSILSAAMKADCGISTSPTCRMRFLPFFCFSRSFFLRLMSPP